MDEVDASGEDIIVVASIFCGIEMFEGSFVEVVANLAHGESDWS